MDQIIPRERAAKPGADQRQIRAGSAHFGVSCYVGSFPQRCTDHDGRWELGRVRRGEGNGGGGRESEREMERVRESLQATGARESVSTMYN